MVKRLYDVYSELPPHLSAPKGSDRIYWICIWQATPLNTEAAGVSEALFNRNWAMRCRVQSKECSTERADRKKLTTADSCIMLGCSCSIGRVWTGSARERNKE